MYVCMYVCMHVHTCVVRYSMMQYVRDWSIRLHQQTLRTKCSSYYIRCADIPTYIHTYMHTFMSSVITNMIFQGTFDAEEEDE